MVDIDESGSRISFSDAFCANPDEWKLTNPASCLFDVSSHYPYFSVRPKHEDFYMCSLPIMILKFSPGETSKVKLINSQPACFRFLRLDFC